MNLDPDQPITQPRIPVATIKLGPSDEITAIGRSLHIGAHRITLADDPAAFRAQAFDLAVAAGHMCMQIPQQRDQEQP